MAEFAQRYRKSGTPLAERGFRSSNSDSPDFSDWELKLHVQYLQLLEESSDDCKGIAFKDLERLSRTALLCCPEDLMCENGCKKQGFLCHRCKIPVCTECVSALQANQIIPQGLINHNFQGYIQSWVYKMHVTWMEKTVSSPYWIGNTLFTIGRRGGERKGRRRHLRHDAMYSFGAASCF